MEFLRTKIGTREEIGETLYFQQAQLRYHVFHERLDWSLPGVNSDAQTEHDQFDHPDTIYILVGDPVIACCRLIPTFRRHMITELWPQLLAGRRLGRHDAWEISRFAVNAAAPSISRQASALLMHTIVEYAIEHGIGSYVIVTSEHFDRFLRRSGVSVERWGVLDDSDGQPIIAGEFLVTQRLSERLIRNMKQLTHTSFSEIALATA